MYKRLKRPLDFVISVSAFLILFPLFLIIVIILSISNKGKPFFIQVRPGLNGKNFKILKFRTMNNRCDKNGKLLPDLDRFTTIGSYLRKTSFDEIPQLINVIRGEMSIIGPRPLLPQYIPLYSSFQARRHEVRPGITGWAQVNGRNAISWNQKFEFDVWYVDNLSFKLDLKIIVLTLSRIFKAEGINQSSETTMEAFKGDN